jgi:hypothetical protein
LELSEGIREDLLSFDLDAYPWHPAYLLLALEVFKLFPEANLLPLKCQKVWHQVEKFEKCGLLILNAFTCLHYLVEELLILDAESAEVLKGPTDFDLSPENLNR